MSERLVVAWCESRLFVRIGSLSLWRGANFDLAPQPSRHFVRVRSLSFWRGADFDWFPKILVKRSFEFSGRTLYEDLARVSWCSLRGPQCIKIVTKVVTSLWEDLVKILLASCKRRLRRSSTGPYQLSETLLEILGPCILSEALLEILVRLSLLGPCVILYRSLSEDLVEIEVLAWRSCRCQWSRGGCIKTLPGCSWEILVMGPGRKILVKVFYSSLWEELVGILVQSSKKSLRYLVQALVSRSCVDLVETLLKRSLH